MAPSDVYPDATLRGGIVANGFRYGRIARYELLANGDVKNQSSSLMGMTGYTQ